MAKTRRSFLLAAVLLATVACSGRGGAVWEAPSPEPPADRGRELPAITPADAAPGEGEPEAPGPDDGEPGAQPDAPDPFEGLAARTTDSCSCATGRAPASAAWWLLLAAWLAGRRVA